MVEGHSILDRVMVLIQISCIIIILIDGHFQYRAFRLIPFHPDNIIAAKQTLESATTIKQKQQN